MPDIGETDIQYMRSALALAQRGVGRTAPNPSVGCVIVKDNIVISRARTADLGRPHAESIAIEEAGGKAHEATLYVTLEPCAHHGVTPPCVQGIIDAKIKRVVIGTLDPNPDVDGKSVKMLKDAGIEVILGVLGDECKELNSGFFKSISNNRPHVTLKMACSLDGKIALENGDSQWITGELARRHAHLLRSRHDAILVGVGTVIKDDPMLSTRFDGIDHNIVRIVLDTNLKTPKNSILLKSAYAVRLWVFHGEEIEKDSDIDFIGGGAVLHQCDPQDLEEVLNILAKKGITRLLVEGGAQVHSSFLKQGLFDELIIYRAPVILGAESKSCSGNLDIKDISESYGFNLSDVRNIGDDVIEIYRAERLVA